MNKETTPLEALEKIGQFTFESGPDDDHTREVELRHYKSFWRYFNTIEKSLKALEVIVEKKVDLIKLFNCFEMKNGYEFYNQGFIEIYKLTQEEYDLLKEVLL